MQNFQTKFQENQSENVFYNQESFPIYLQRGFLSYFPNYSEKSHWHPDLEFLWVKKGSMEYQVQEETVVLSEGEGIFVNTQRIHHGYSKHKEECDFICSLFHPSLLSANYYFYREYVEPLLKNQHFQYLHLQNSIPWQKCILDQLEQLYHRKNQKDYYFQVQITLLEIVKILVEHQPEKQSTIHSSSLNSLKLMVLYIQSHYHQQFSLEEIAKAGYCSKSKANYLFQKYLKKSPMDYAIEYRLNRSCSFLKETGMSITTIALRCGFNSLSYFGKLFQRQYHCSPKEFRKQNHYKNRV